MNPQSFLLGASENHSDFYYLNSGRKIKERSRQIIFDFT